MTALRDTRLELERATEAAQFPVGVFWTDTTGSCHKVNARWCELSGLDEEESLGYGWSQAIHPDDRTRVAEEQARSLRSGKNLRIEFRLLRPDGTVRWVLSQTVGSFDDDGGLRGFVGTITDINDRVDAEAARRESEERFRGLVELAPDFVAIHRDGVMLYVNPAGLRMMRAEAPSDLCGHHILEFVLPEHQANAVERMRELRDGRDIALTEMEVRRCDGETIWIETIASRTIWEGGPAVQLVARDVTDRRKLAEAYRVLVESVRDAMWIMDRGGDGEWRATFMNRSYALQAGIVAPDTILNRTPRELAEQGIIAPADAEESLRLYEEAARSNRPTENETRITVNGNEVFLVTTITPVRDELGRCHRLICWSRDVSRSRAREWALAESEANYRAVVEGTSDAVWVMDRGPDGSYRVRLANSRTARLLGVPVDQMLGKTLQEFLTRDAADRAVENYRRAEESGEPIEYETVIERKGFRTEVVTHLTPLFDGEGRCYRIIGSARDVSDRRRAEMALLQAQKLESLGVLAGGIAHDFNNLLTTILGNLYLLEGELTEDSPLRAFTVDSRVAAERGADLVRRLLDFSRPGAHANDVVRLDRLFSETASLVGRTLGPAIALRFDNEPGEAAVVGEFSALQQVLVNLLLNARDSMAEGGTVQVSCRRRDIGAEQIWRQRGLAAGAYHEVLVSDGGAGMNRDVLQRIFDPFFTTKGMGKGTGLGLSTALSIVRAHGGWLEAESEPGEGSTFRLLLPAAKV
jgi:PAS domain S-box-containing protein